MRNANHTEAGYSLVEVLVTLPIVVLLSFTVLDMVSKAILVADPIKHASHLMDVKYYIASNFSCRATLKRNTCPKNVGKRVETYRRDGKVLTNRAGRRFHKAINVYAKCINEGTSPLNKFEFYYDTDFTEEVSLFHGIPMVCHQGVENLPELEENEEDENMEEEEDENQEDETVDFGPLPSEIDCDNAELQVYEKIISFPQTKECVWGEGNQLISGNLSRKQGYVRARKVQTDTANLPENAFICGIKLRSRTETWHYDDFTVLTLNNSVLFSSNEEFIERLGTETFNLYNWVWENVRNHDVDSFDSGAYCVRGECDLPPHDKSGRIKVEPADEIVYELAARNFGQPLHFNLITTGDNNPDFSIGGEDEGDDEEDIQIDCMQSGLDFDLTVHYYLNENY